MKIQIDLPKELGDKLKIYKVENNFERQADALVDIIRKFFGGSK